MILRIAAPLGEIVLPVESAGAIRETGTGESRSLSITVQNGSGGATRDASRADVLLSTATFEIGGTVYFRGLIQSIRIGAMIDFNLEG
jgi:hypothetical protein